MSIFFFNDTTTTEIYTLSLHERSSDLAWWFDQCGDPPSGHRWSNWHIAQARRLGWSGAERPNVSESYALREISDGRFLLCGRLAGSSPDARDSRAAAS